MPHQNRHSSRSSSSHTTHRSNSNPNHHSASRSSRPSGSSGFNRPKGPAPGPGRMPGPGPRMPKPPRPPRYRPRPLFFGGFRPRRPRVYGGPVFVRPLFGIGSIIVLFILLLVLLFSVSSCTRPSVGYNGPYAIAESGNDQLAIEEIKDEIICFMDDLNIQDLESARDHLLSLNDPLPYGRPDSYSIRSVKLNGTRASAVVDTSEGVWVFEFLDDGDWWLISSVEEEV